MNDNIEVSGLLYKKRGGFGKIMPNAWQFRYFTISREGMLSYYDTEVPDAAVAESKARGKLDLSCVNYELNLDQIEGAPTAYSIQVCPPGEEKWKMCAETKEDHTRWCKTLDKFQHEKKLKPAVGSPVSYSSDDDAEQKRNRSRVNSGRLGNATDTLPTTNDQIDNVQKPPAVVVVTEHKHTNHHSISSPVKSGRKRLKLGNKAEMISSNTMESVLVLIILNICFYPVATSADSLLDVRKLVFIFVANFVVAHTLRLRAGRTAAAVASAAHLSASCQDNNKTDSVMSAAVSQSLSGGNDLIAANESIAAAAAAAAGTSISMGSSSDKSVDDAVQIVKSGTKPKPGFTFTEVTTEPRLSAPHTWCRVDHRQFNVRVGPDYNRYKKKAPSGPPLYEPFAVDVFCTKLRVDHAAARFQLPDTSDINTNNEFVPPIMVVQIQIPSEPPTSFFSSAEDGPGWAIVMYYKITEDVCNQLKDLSTASAAVKLWAEWCEKAPADAAWRGRFKVINSCTNLEELGMPSAIVSYNAKPVLIRRTGTIFRGPNYLEMNIHVHKFANLAKQSIYLISSRCGLMFMQIGFVIEGREDKELPEAMFACEAVNKPQEDQAEFIFEDEE